MMENFDISKCFDGVISRGERERERDDARWRKV